MAGKEENWVPGKLGSRGFLAFFTEQPQKGVAQICWTGKSVSWGPRMHPLDIQLDSYRGRAFPSCSEPMTERHGDSSAISTNKLLFSTLTVLARGLPISLAKIFLKLLCNQNLPSKSSFSFLSYQPCRVNWRLSLPTTVFFSILQSCFASLIFFTSNPI